MKRRYTEEQKAKSREAQRIRRAKNPDRVREVGREAEFRRRLRKYGLTSEQLHLLYLHQNNKCAICDKELLKNRHTHIDHCHTSGRVRGLLCSKCNLMLGHANDSITILTRAITYLND